MPEIVINTSPWISLSIIKKIDILPKIYKKIFMPEGVVEEIMNNKSKNYGKQELKKCKWIKKTAFKENSYSRKLINDLDKGELEVILLAKELNIKNVLMDETIGRKTAKLQGLKPIGTLGLLVKAKKMKIIKEVKPLINILLKNNIWLSEELISKILKNINE